MSIHHLSTHDSFSRSGPVAKLPADDDEAKQPIIAPDGVTPLEPMAIDPLFVHRCQDSEGNDLVVLALGVDVRTARVYAMDPVSARALAAQLANALKNDVLRVA